jgi:hypothetical protein
MELATGLQPAITASSIFIEPHVDKSPFYDVASVPLLRPGKIGFRDRNVLAMLLSLRDPAWKVHESLRIRGYLRAWRVGSRTKAGFSANDLSNRSVGIRTITGAGK